MENVKIILDNGAETNVNGIFYVFNSKYYFIYTSGELDETGYVKLYVVQVCKEVQKTPTGPVDTGYMLGMEIKDSDEWSKVQTSITKIVEDKKNRTQSPEIQYLPMNMLVNLKIVSKNKFKLVKEIVENNFKITITPQALPAVNNVVNSVLDLNLDSNVPLNQSSIEEIKPLETLNNNVLPATNLETINNVIETENKSEVIIDYRARFFEEQEKNQQLEEQIRILNEKLENIKNIIG